ncbi:MAG: hypothetical protein HZB70_03505 [Candidatus Berkelbacteria bacterium]|nr:MAG: hypothetical protein HZB70_03505 [Candidatus Berkelbacteria bacterium]QQG51632.1 MAG: hypothetical protein HY845_03685 [Candidatus Berkelbacteria bacterium]
MKNLLSLVIVAAIAAISVAQTSISWFDITKGGQPSLTTAFISNEGWELWAFGANNSKTLDLEFGQLYPVGKNWLIGGYGVVWPSSSKLFALPFVIYKDSVLGGKLVLKLGHYVPLNGGPTITFSDESSLLWEVRTGISMGPIVSYSKVNELKPTIKLGLTLRLSKGKETLELSCQPFYLSDSGETRFRVGLTTRF